MENRLHGIDFCRAVFMLLGLFYHVGLIYTDGHHAFVSSEDSSLVLQNISHFLHSFRMQAFYVISGFFYMLVYQKRPSGFLADRLMRSIIPLFFCGILINPLMFYFSTTENIEFSLDFILSGKWMVHLWFLGNLTFYFIIFFPLCNWIVSTRPLKSVELFIGIIVVTPILSVIGIIITNLTYEGRFFIFTFANLLYFSSYFFLGCICYRNRDVFLKLLNIKYFTISTFIYFLAIFFLEALNLDGLVRYLFEAAITGSLIFSVTALTYNIGKRKNTFIRQISDSSYTIYLLHQPLIIILYAKFFDGLNLNPIIEYTVIIFIVFSISFVFHFVLVDNNKYIKFLMNGVPLKRQ